MIKMKSILFILFISFSITQDHFVLEIDETGESTLFLFEDSITTLGLGDEIGIFANSLLVGAGVWNGEDLPIIAIHEIDLSDFGGPVLPGASSNDSLEIKIWSSFSDIEYIVSPIFSFGEGAFNGLLTVITTLDCTGEIDECGVCLGPGNVFECGCYNIPDEECDCNGNILDCSNVCGGDAIIDECGVCEGDNSSCLDCLGIPNGSAILDECGVCDGDNSSCLDCLGIPNGNAVEDECGICEGDNSSCSDCLGIPNGNAIVDNCGICNGNNTTCNNPEAVLSFYDMGGVVLTNISYENLLSEVCLENVILSNPNAVSLETASESCINPSENIGVLPIYMKSTQPVSGFQFNIIGLTIIEAFGGSAEDAGFIVSTSESVVVGFSFSGSTIEPSGDFYGCMDQSACNYNMNATVSDDSCQYPDEGFDCEGNCLDDDCAGECGGDAILDECGICEGPGAIYECGCFDIPDGDCDCDNNIFDCEGICGGPAELDCMDVCNGTAILDECGICEGPGATFECDDGTFVCVEDWCDDDDGGGGSGGGGGDSECLENEVEDCFGNCGPASWLGDGYCDESMVDFNCLALAYDMGDCEIDFTNHVMPLIIANCTGYCHSGASNYQGGLNLETYAGLMDGGNSGPAVIPYYPDYSLIIQKLNGDAPGAQMPDQASPLPDNYINTIYYWIEQGAIGSDDNGWEDACVGEDEIEDCNGECVDDNLLGDGNCDDGEDGEANFNCAQYIFDNTDCPVGVLEFGSYEYNNTNNSGTIEILMNCEFPVSNFEIGISGVEISDVYGGTSGELDFDISYTISSFSGSIQNEFIPPNSGLLATIVFDSIDENLTEICFDNSLITTSAGYQYEAVLGDCISIEMLGDYAQPNDFLINNIFPNPFNPMTTISYSIPNSQVISINIYTLKGEKIQTLLNEFKTPGNYNINWDASGFASGVYILQLQGENSSVTQKLTLSK